LWPESGLGPVSERPASGLRRALVRPEFPGYRSASERGPVPERPGLRPASVARPQLAGLGPASVHGPELPGTGPALAGLEPGSPPLRSRVGLRAVRSELLPSSRL